MPAKCFIGIDIEKAGAGIENPVVAVGVATVVVDGGGDITITEQKRWAIRCKLPQALGSELVYNDFEPRCWDEFWVPKAGPVLTWLQKENEEGTALTVAEAMQELRTFIDTVCTAFPECVCRVVSDNPAFDAGILSHMLATHGHKPLEWQRRPDRKDDYRYCGVRCGTPVYILRKKGAVSFDLPDCPMQHTHFPDEDAARIAWKYAWMNKAMGLD